MLTTDINKVDVGVILRVSLVTRLKLSQFLFLVFNMEEESDLPNNRNPSGDWDTPQKIICPYCNVIFYCEEECIKHMTATCGKHLSAAKIQEAVILLKKQSVEWANIGIEYPGFRRAKNQQYTEDSTSKSVNGEAKLVKTKDTKPLRNITN